MSRRFQIASVVLVLILVFGAGIYYWRHHSSQQQPSEVKKTVEQILKEREENATRSLKAGKGALFNEHKWEELKKVYQPADDYIELAEWIRAKFISGGFKTETEEDFDQILELVLTTLSSLDPKVIKLAQPLMLQAQRLPSPKKGSKNYLELEKWINQSKLDSSLKKVALIKLCVNAENPERKWVDYFITSLFGKRLGLELNEWLIMIDQTRNVTVRESMIRSLFRSYKKLEQSQQPYALVMMAKYSEIDLKMIKSLAMSYLRSSKLNEFESGLRVMGQLIQKKQLNDSEKSKLQSILDGMSADLKTPFIMTKTREIMNAL